MRCCRDHPNKLTRAQVTCPGATCQTPPAHPSPGAQGQSAGPSLRRAHGQDRVGCKLMRSASRVRTVKSCGGWGGKGSRQTLKLALSKQLRGTKERRWRPLPWWPPGSFPREPDPRLRLPPVTGPGAGPAHGKGSLLEIGSGNTCSLLRPWALSLLPQLRQKI